jgi:glutamate/tyrosine decarboxylase-like PLP-dependent enzyme
MTFDPSLEEMRRIGHLAVDRAIEHLEHLGESRVVSRPLAEQLVPLVAEPLPRAGKGLDDSIRRYFEDLLPRATFVNHPRFFAFIPGPGSFAGAVGEWLAASTNLFVGSWLGGASMAQLEIQVLDWLREMLRLPDGFTGIITSGGSVANMSGLAAARTRIGDLSRASVYTSAEAHYSIAKAARILGLRAENVRTLEVDENQRLRPEAVAEALERDRRAGLLPMALCATAGTTNTGAVDPLQELADLCEEEGLWLHVDAAYGAGIALVAEGARLLAGLDRADSITLDPHKWFYCPFECGCLLTRRPEELSHAFQGDASYMQDVPRDEVNFFTRGPELSRGNRALKLWMLLRAVGVDAIADAVARDIRHCHLACELLEQDPRIRIVTRPRLSVFTFSVKGGDASGQRLMDAIMDDGYLMLSSSLVGDRFVLRFCVANHRTTEDDIRTSVKRIRSLLHDLETGPGD